MIKSGGARDGHCDKLGRMSLAYASDHLTAAVRALAASEAPLTTRLQSAWDDHVQMVWMKPCLTTDLLREFKALWERYTAPSDDKHSTTLRALTPTEAIDAINDVVSLATKVEVATALSADEKLATIADLG